MAGTVLRMLCAAMVVAVVSQGTACASRSPEDPEEIAAFREDLRANVDTVDALLQQTRDGHNVSGFGMGMFAMTVLNELATRDADLERHIHAGDRSTDLYLREVFQARPVSEIKALHDMADRGDRTLRLAAQHLLEALRHVPDRDDPPAAQAHDRQRLAAELMVLGGLLDRAASEAAP